MSNAEARTGTRRIAVALDASAHGLRVMDLAAGVAALLEAELEGVFVEDTELIRSAGLPFLRELRLATLDESALDAERLQRELRAAARRVREHLEQSARALGLASSFRVWRGDLGAEILAASVDAELFALGRIGRFAPLRSRPKRVRIPYRPGHLAVGFLFDGGDASVQALITAADLARDRRAAVSVILEPTPAADIDALWAQATEILRTVRTRALLIDPGSGGTAALARAVISAGIDLLVVDCENPMLATPTLWEHLEAIDCPVLIHRPARR